MAAAPDAKKVRPMVFYYLGYFAGKLGKTGRAGEAGPSVPA